MMSVCMSSKVLQASSSSLSILWVLINYRLYSVVPLKNLQRVASKCLGLQFVYRLAFFYSNSQL